VGKGGGGVLQGPMKFETERGGETKKKTFSKGEKKNLAQATRSSFGKGKLWAVDGVLVCHTSSCRFSKQITTQTSKGERGGRTCVTGMTSRSRE